MRISPSLLTLAGSLLAGQVLSKPFGLNPSYNSVNGLGVDNKTASTINSTYVTPTTTLSTTTTSTASVAVVSVNNGTVTSLKSEFHGPMTSSTWTSDDIVFTTSTLTLTSTFTDSIPSNAAGSASNDSGKLTAACTATATVTNTVTQTTSVTLTSVSYITVGCAGTSQVRSPNKVAVSSTSNDGTFYFQTTAIGSSVSTSWLGDKSPNPTEPVVVLTTTVPVFPVPSSSGMNSIVTTAYDSTTYTIQVFPPSEVSSTVTASATDTIAKQSPKITESASGASSQDVTLHITSTVTQQSTRTSVVHPLPSGNGTASTGNSTSSDSGADNDVTVFLTSSSTTTVTAPYGNSTVATSSATGNIDTTVTVSSTLTLTSTAPFSNSSGVSTVSSDDVTVTTTSIQFFTSTLGMSTASSADVTVTTTSIQFSTSTMSGNFSSPATSTATDQVVSITSTKTLTSTCSSHTSIVPPSSIATSSLSSDDITVTTTTTTRITSTLSSPASNVATASNAVVSISAPLPYFALGTATDNKQRRSAPISDTISAESTVFAPPGRSSVTVQVPAIATIPLAPSVIAQRPTVTPSQPKSMGTIGVTTQIPSSSSSAPYVLMSLPPNGTTSSASLDVIMSLAPDVPATPSAPFVLMSLPPVVTVSNPSSIASAHTSTSVPHIPTSCPPGMQYGNYPENFLRYSPGYRAVDALKKPGLSVYDPKQNSGATETLDVLGLHYGEIGAASHAGDSQYWYDFTSVDLACMGSACTIEISAMKYDIFKWKEYAAHTITMWAPGCDKADNCTMMHRQLLPADKFTGLSGIQIVAYNDSGHTTAGKRPLASFAIDKLNVGWYNTTCEAGTWRVTHQ